VGVELAWLRPDAAALSVAVLADLLSGDPVYRLHPVRLIGQLLTVTERALRSAGLDGRLGGVLLFVALSALSIGAVALVVSIAGAIGPWPGWIAHTFFVYSFLALGDLLHHVWRVERAASAGDVARARLEVANLVGRDTDRMDEAACRRASIESLGESLTDGFTSALFWYLVGGLPGLTLFKVVSTMDSMVGYKTPRYLYFGWAGARLDDLMNFVPARVTWLLISIAAAIVPGASARQAIAIGWHQHSTLLGPNAGWSEAATAGAIRRRLVGPIWRGGQMVTDVWIGHPDDPPAATREDVWRAAAVCTAAGLLAVLIVVGILIGARA
jgi:adenosylcobinamide-phosphate synthase